MAENDITPGEDGYISWRTKETNYTYINKGPLSLPWRKHGAVGNNIPREYRQPWSEMSLADTTKNDNHAVIGEQNEKVSEMKVYFTLIFIFCVSIIDVMI